MQVGGWKAGVAVKWSQQQCHRFPSPGSGQRESATSQPPSRQRLCWRWEAAVRCLPSATDAAAANGLFWFPI